jgi:hypothetical protein
MSKHSTKPTEPKRSGDQIHIVGEPGKSKERSLADVALDPSSSAAVTIRSFTKGTFGETDLGSIYEALRDTATAVKRGDLGSAETMLVAQAATLNALFVELTRRSGVNMGEYLDAADRYMRLALKAQAQCRATLETLATIKNPPVVYARQANIAAGPQQVNNGVAPPPAGENQNRPNKLLEERHELDGGTASPATRGDPALATLGAGDGTAHR